MCSSTCRKRTRSRGARQGALGPLGPLDEHDRTVEVGLDRSPVGLGHAGKAIEIEVRDRHAPLVAMPDRVGRARHGLRDAERPAGAADERRLAAAELAGDEDDVARLEARGDARGERLGLLG